MLVGEAPKISVIIPAYNAEGTIEKAIQSVWAQSVPVQEVVVGDDGSSDRTAELAEAAGAIVLRLPRGNGSIARNRAVEKATGELLFFLDADDWWHPEKVAAHLEVWNRPDPPAFVVDIATKVTPEGREVGLLGEGPEGKVSWEQYLVWTTWTSGSSFSIKRDNYWGIGGFSENLVSQQDVDFWVRAAHEYGGAYRIGCALTYYLLSPGGVSKTPNDVSNNIEKVLEKWPFASGLQKREFRMQMLLTAAGFSAFPRCFEYYKQAGWPLHRVKFWRSLCRSVLRAVRPQ